jgi:hypothetical protein
VSTAELPSADEIVWAPSPTGDAKGNGDAKRPRAPRPEKEQAPPPRPLPGARTTRVVLRTLDPWSVLKLSLVFYLALFVVILVAGTLLWAGASAAGVVGNIEDFMVDIGFEDFRFIPSKLFAGVALGGLVLVVAGTCANVLMTALFNLMSDVVGGLKVTLQEDGRTPNAKDDGTATI